MKKTVVLFAHPFFEHSKFNRKIVDIYRQSPYLHFRDLYEEIPDFHVHGFLERQKMEAYDQIIFHFPIIWLSPPPLLNLWKGEVLDMKWLNSNEGNPFLGKKVMIIATAGGSKEAFSADGLYGKTLESFIFPLRKSLELVGAEVVSKQVAYSAKNTEATTIASIRKAIDDFVQPSTESL